MLGRYIGLFVRTSEHRKICGAAAGVIAAAILAPVAVAQSVQPPTRALFAVYPDAQGTLKTESTDPSTLNTKNPFFDPSIGSNGQACVTCHEPSLGITISVPFINQAFNTSEGTGPLFRFNDTANNPFTTTHNAVDYSLILHLGVVRIGKTIPAAADFTAVAGDADTDTIFAAPETFPLTGDPQHPGMPTLSLFRRPLVNTNVNFDSAVFWDGRENISALNVQVEQSIQTLLLGAGTDLTGVDQSIADFQTGVYTDQESTNLAGELNARGATGGVGNLLALSQSPSRPCVFDEEGDLTPFVAAVATSTSCTSVTVGGQLATPPGPPTFTLFDSWTNLPNNPRNAGRLSVARGQAVFNQTGCVFCHTVPNLGNNASAEAAGFKAIGTDSLFVLEKVKALAPTPAEAQMVQDMIDRVNQLPLYCLRPNTDTSGSPCGSDATDVLTTDPGHRSHHGRQQCGDDWDRDECSDGCVVQAADLARLGGASAFLSRRRGSGHAAFGNLLQSEVRFRAHGCPANRSDKLPKRVVEESSRCCWQPRRASGAHDVVISLFNPAPRAERF